MFTFVRILTRNTAQKSEPDHPCRQNDTSEETPEALPARPWQQELDRLAGCQCAESEWPKSKYRSSGHPIELPNKPIRQGTLTDQKVWWGRALHHNTIAPEQGFATQYRRPPKTINHWQQ
jgi:hypothetical protein